MPARTPTLSSVGTLQGSGTISLGMRGTLSLGQGSAATDVTVRFADAGGLLRIVAPKSYTGRVENFLPGDIIEGGRGDLGKGGHIVQKRNQPDAHPCVRSFSGGPEARPVAVRPCAEPPPRERKRAALGTVRGR